MKSKFGLVSFIIAIISCILSFIVLPMLIWRAITSGAVADIGTAVGFGTAVLILVFVGLALGILGKMKDETKTFAIIGLIFSIICLIYLLGAMAIGAVNIETPLWATTRSGQ